MRNALPAQDASAAALQVSPICLDLSAQQPAAALTLRNDGTTPLNAQVRVFAWSQTPDEDRLERTDRVVASPPIVQVAPGADQIVRILRPSGAPVDTEETYRLLIDEIPDGTDAQLTGVGVQLRYSVPVFVGAPASATLPAIDFALERGTATPAVASGSSGAAGHARLLLRAAMRVTRN